jgi:hypothetical protein
MQYLSPTSELDVNKRLPRGIEIPDCFDPLARPLCTCKRNSAILFVMTGSSIITNKVVFDKISRIFGLKGN